MMNSPRFEDLKKRYGMGFVTEFQLRQYVLIGQKRPEYGITANEYEQITGEAYVTNQTP